MKYFFDTEFIEGPQDKRFFGLKYGQTKPTIDLISIGIVSEDIKHPDKNVAKNIVENREYYAISKDFNLKQTWKNEWVRENVLKPIFFDLRSRSLEDDNYCKNHLWTVGSGFDKTHLRDLINWYGKTNKQIAQEIKEFCTGDQLSVEKAKHYNVSHDTPEFWACYADYDWVVFCQLFGRMIDLPKGFPMYCRDLKQFFDDINIEVVKKAFGVTSLKEHPNYPKQENEHNALDDARWNKELYQFLINL